MSPLRTVLVGLGNMGAEYVADTRMAAAVPYATHGQVLSEHPGFDWVCGFDRRREACESVSNRWGVQAMTSLAHYEAAESVDVLVLATPPSFRRQALSAFPNLRGVVIEKPLSTELGEARRFVSECAQRGIVTQVNLTRRVDSAMKALANGGLQKAIGSVQCGFGVYGNGLRNYATHTIDLVRMLLGKVVSVRALAADRAYEEGPVPGDLNMAFVLELDGAHVVIQPVSFQHYREGSLDLWGTRGRLEILQEGLRLRNAGTGPCRSLSNAAELTHDESIFRTTGYGRALYDLYDDLAVSVAQGQPPASSAESALETEIIVEAIIESSVSGSSVLC
jgi:predicted dehydrogenase